MAKLVLVVDDERDIFEIIRLLLEPDGLRVEGAKNGALALERIASLKPDLIVLDLMLPLVSGVDILQQLQGKEAAKIPVVVLSALGEAAAARQQAVRFPNVKSVVGKPCSNEELRKRILEALA